MSISLPRWIVFLWWLCASSRWCPLPDASQHLALNIYSFAPLGHCGHAVVLNWYEGIPWYSPIKSWKQPEELGTLQFRSLIFSSVPCSLGSGADATTSTPTEHDVCRNMMKPALQLSGINGEISTMIFFEKRFWPKADMDEGSSHIVAAWNHFHCFRLGALVSVRHLSRSHSTQTKIVTKSVFCCMAAGPASRSRFSSCAWIKIYGHWAKLTPLYNNSVSYEANTQESSEGLMFD